MEFSGVEVGGFVVICEGDSKETEDKSGIYYEPWWACECQTCGKYFDLKWSDIDLIIKQIGEKYE